MKIYADILKIAKAIFISCFPNVMEWVVTKSKGDVASEWARFPPLGKRLGKKTILNELIDTIKNWECIKHINKKMSRIVEKINSVS